MNSCLSPQATKLDRTEVPTHGTVLHSGRCIQDVLTYNELNSVTSDSTTCPNAP